MVSSERWFETCSEVFLSIPGVSAAGNVIVKALLNEFPFPLTVTLAQLFSVWILSIPLLRYDFYPRLSMSISILIEYKKCHHLNISIKIVFII